MGISVNEIFVEQDNFISDFNRWVEGKETKYIHIEEIYKEIEPYLKNRFTPMNRDFCYDKRINGCWLGLCKNGFKYISLNNHKNLDKAIPELRKFYRNNSIDIPTKSELIKLTNLSGNLLFNTRYNRPERYRNIQYKDTYHTQTFDMNSDKLIDVSYNGCIYPIWRLTNSSKKLTNKEHFLLWISNGLKPKGFNSTSYNKLLKGSIELDSLTIKGFKSIKISQENILKELLEADKIRANIIEYREKLLLDVNKGSWEVFTQIDDKKFQNPAMVILPKTIIAKDPKESIVQGGVIGIDFGTKSTVVVYQKESEVVLPIRVGIGDWNKAEKPYHYENPTVMEFIDLEQFLGDYRKPIFRPYTKWNDLTISHTAYTNLQNSHSNQFNSYLTELKQWAGDKNRKLKIQDQKGVIYEIKEFINIEKDDINPIEIYAYYLGLYINNQHQDSIFLEYLLSFPITYEIEVREKIAQSFRRGIAKSLPDIGDRANDLKVISGVSEPASYASVALQEYGLAEDNEKNFYGIFDFGGGTTDFDFGIFRWSDEEDKKERRFDYVIEHFGAGGDRYLGGENLLEMLAFEIFKRNRDTLREQQISFTLPPEGIEFLGSELLLSDSREARLNTVSLASRLREFWEREEYSEESIYPDGLKVDLYDNSSKKIAKVVLEIDENKLLEILRARIAKGVEAFFVGITKAFYSQQNEIEFDIDTINIFLAGNSSKSPIVKELFEQNIKEFEEEFREANIDASIKIYNPLENQDDFNKPNGKTGVAFGLIETRAGGRILVIDKNIKDDNISFKYYLGINKRRKFRVVIDRDSNYNQWIEFVDASQESFEVYYTSSPLANKNSLPIKDSSIKKVRSNISKVDEDLSVFIRLTDSTTFEYGVGSGVDDVEGVSVIKL